MKYFRYPNGIYEAGETVPNGCIEVPEIPLDYLWERVREIRDELLRACDFTQLEDATVDKQAWAEYRQALRDIPQNFPDPQKISWPGVPK